ncbi:hypothetical protein DWW18_00125 [Butyricimonas virosa]|uniref:Uncharacterized protein n=1 Tax=Butyricimonas virosa TaxID=544645 RepID=A0A412X6P7_9BACT|nr:hypothetical protein [Butyricimonas virosa]RGV36646.1 hypothetical protein DWW18_00125 [Butyricimonas virosa]
MVEIKSGLLKDACGRHDGMVIYKKRGKTFGRKLPSYDGNVDSPTRAKQNARLSSVVTLYQSVKNTFLVYSWNREATNRDISSGYNLFVKENIKAFDSDYNVGDFALLKFTLGDLQIPFQFRQQQAPEGIFSITWDTTPWICDRRNKDKLILAIIYDNEPFRIQIIENTGISRNDGIANIPLEQPEATEAHVYAFFTNTDRDSFTNSLYYRVKLK